MYDPALGRFCSKDPIGYVDGSNCYQLVPSDVLEGTDPSGLLKVQLTPIRPPKRTTCVSATEQSWKISIDKAKPVAGWIIQKVCFECGHEPCPCASHTQPRNYKFHSRKQCFLEAWRVNPNETNAGNDRFFDSPKTSTGLGQPATIKGCRTMWIDGEMIYLSDPALRQILKREYGARWRTFFRPGYRSVSSKCGKGKIGPYTGDLSKFEDLKRASEDRGNESAKHGMISEYSSKQTFAELF